MSAGKLFAKGAPYIAAALLLWLPCYVMGEARAAMTRLPRVAIEYEYADARDFHEGLAAVKSKDAWGYINNLGHVALPLPQQSPERLQHALQARRQHTLARLPACPQHAQQAPHKPVPARYHSDLQQGKPRRKPPTNPSTSANACCTWRSCSFSWLLFFTVLTNCSAEQAWPVASP